MKDVMSIQARLSQAIKYCEDNIPLTSERVHLKQALITIRAFEIQQTRQMIKTLSWITEHMKWREDEINGNVEIGSQGYYSDELKEALQLLEDLKGGD